MNKVEKNLTLGYKLESIYKLWTVLLLLTMLSLSLSLSSIHMEFVLCTI